MAKIIVRQAGVDKQGQLTLYSTSLNVSDMLTPNFYILETLDPDDCNDTYYG